MREGDPHRSRRQRRRPPRTGGARRGAEPDAPPLRPDYRAAIALRYDQQLPFDEIGQILGVPGSQPALAFTVPAGTGSIAGGAGLGTLAMTGPRAAGSRFRFAKPGKAMNDQQSRDWRRWVEAEQAGEDDAADALFSGLPGVGRLDLPSAQFTATPWPLWLRLRPATPGRRIRAIGWPVAIVAAVLIVYTTAGLMMSAFSAIVVGALDLPVRPW